NLNYRSFYYYGVYLLLFFASCSGTAENNTSTQPEDNTIPEMDTIITPIVEKDSLALMWIYENTNANQWIVKWDLTSPVRIWHGVEVDENGKVTFLNLSNNNLTGDLSKHNLADHIDFDFDFKGNPFKAYYASEDKGIIEEYNMVDNIEDPIQINDTIN